MARQTATSSTPQAIVKAAKIRRRVLVSFSSSVSSVTASSGISSGSRYRVCCRGDGEPKSSRTVMDHAMTATPMPRDSSKKSGSWVRRASLPLRGRCSPQSGSSTGNTQNASTANSASHTSANGRNRHCSAVSQPVWWHDKASWRAELACNAALLGSFLVCFLLAKATLFRGLGNNKEKVQAHYRMRQVP